MDASGIGSLRPLTTKDPLALLLVGQQALGELSLDMDELEWASCLLDAAAFGDTGNIQRYAQRLDDQFFLFDEKCDKQETANRRFFVACVVTLAVLHNQEHTLYAFPSTWWDGDLVSKEEFALLERNLEPGPRTMAKSLTGLTIQGWVALNGSVETIKSLDTERNGLRNRTATAGHDSICALHAGLLWNSDAQSVGMLVDIWTHSLHDYKEAKDRAKIFSELGTYKATNLILDRLLERWIDVQAPGLRGSPKECQQAGQELLSHPVAWAQWSTSTEAAAAFYEKVFDLAWPGYPKTTHSPAPEMKQLFQALVAGRMEVRELGLEGCARAAERIGHMLGQDDPWVSERDKGLLKMLGAEISNMCQQAGLAAPPKLGEVGGRKRQAMAWLATAQIARRNELCLPRPKRKL